LSPLVFVLAHLSGKNRESTQLPEELTGAPPRPLRVNVRAQPDPDLCNNADIRLNKYAAFDFRIPAVRAGLVCPALPHISARVFPCGVSSFSNHFAGGSARLFMDSLHPLLAAKR
ncbi:hypothetical protein PO002_44915, partial [Cupriavidus necator]|uniref:hypothetical protein n=1 Tax=Cupriavidus necator TaxID=106590 RepID=UPI0039C075CB